MSTFTATLDMRLIALSEPDDGYLLWVYLSLFRTIAECRSPRYIYSDCISVGRLGFKLYLHLGGSILKLIGFGLRFLSGPTAPVRHAHRRQGH